MNLIEFPRAPCDVCNIHFDRPKEGLVIAGPFNYYLIEQAGKYGNMMPALSTMERILVNRITTEYFDQFPEIFKFEGYTERDALIDSKAHAYRLTRVLKTNLKKSLILLIHKDCLPPGRLPIAFKKATNELINKEKRDDFKKVISDVEFFRRGAWRYLCAKLFGESKSFA